MAEDGRQDYVSSTHKPPGLLPIAKHEQSLVYMVETQPVVIVVGQTGSGKTTQIPQYLDRAGWTQGKMIAITQPRRVAATSVAARVAEEMGCKLGEAVGYSIRFEDVTTTETRIKFMTDGMLLREALVDPLLSRYSVIMVDEAHERSLSTDVLLGVLKKILKRRPELRIIISSATLQAEDFSAFFNDDLSQPSDDPASLTRGIISLEGRTFPVDILYLEKPAEDYIDTAVSLVFSIHASENEGDVLIFLTGRDEIERTTGMIAERAGNLAADADAIQVLPMYAGLPADQQMYVFETAPEKTRKVVVATNIAEASVTIEGIKYVIDCGFVKLRAFNPSTAIETLTTVPVSKASATQRAGRAGRTRAGKCFRLYTEDAFDRLPEVTVPEIQRSNLAPMVLQLKALGIDNINRFDFFTPPPVELIARALEFLYSLGAVDSYAKLSRPVGIRMAELAVEPIMAKVLLEATRFECLPQMLSIAAMVSLQGAVWFEHEGGKKLADSAKHRFAVEEGDHLTLLNVYQAFVTKGKRDAKWCRDNFLNYKSMVKATAVRAQLRRYLEKFGITVPGDTSATARSQDGVDTGERIRRCLTTGLFAHAARMQADGSFKPISGEQSLYAHPSSMMFNRKADWIIFQDIMETGTKTYIREITKIEKSWLLEYAEDYYQIR